MLYHVFSLVWTGFKVQLFSGEEIVSYVSVIACTCDLPARAIMMNMVQYNGFYGCSHCMQKGNVCISYVCSLFNYRFILQ